MAYNNIWEFLDQISDQISMTPNSMLSSFPEHVVKYFMNNIDNQKEEVSMWQKKEHMT